MRYVSSALRRADNVDTGRYVSWWSSGCDNWAIDNNIAPTGINRSFFLSAIALRIPFVMPDPSMGVVGTLGLRQHGGSPMAADDWRKTLGDDVLPPVIMAR
jgi:hypothetical protein